MPRSIKALCNHQLLEWARRSAGYDKASAAKRLSVDVDILDKWESGYVSPTIAQLRKIGDVYKRPIAVFYLPEIPTDFAPLKDFRRLAGEPERPFSPELLLAIRRTRLRQEWICDYRQEQKKKPLPFLGSLEPDMRSIVSAAETARRVLKIKFQDQRDWSDTNEALRQWTAHCEAIGVYVFQASGISVKEMRGCAIADQYAPAIILNTKDARSARIFSLLHEFAHILIGADGVSDLNVPQSGNTQNTRIERFCNALAAEILAPREDFKEMVSQQRGTSFDEAVKTLAKLLNVSREVVVIRLRDLRNISHEKCQEKCDQYKAEHESQPKRQNIIIPRPRIIIQSNGRAFTRLVIRAYDDGLIGARDVSGLLDTKLKHLPGIEADLFPRKLSRGVET